ncbi:protein S40-4-like [Vicia villosa]|uniref:protein S40-4-like n=1 Tax=Vicia villosa TaxID=3911 RepID=UPI00273BF5BF|nr:protein S40-4-like [Vicia villosa]XP_058788186.1 protein S40-4-like [Vicia villosa]
MDDKYRLVRKHSGLWRTLRDGDFEEEEVWDVVKEREDYSCEVVHHKAKNKELSSLSIPIGSRTIPIPSSSHETKGFQQSSAPVNIPDWSKVYGGNDKVINKSVKNVSRYGNDNYGFYDDHEDGHDEVLNHDDGDDEDEDEDDDDGEYGTRLPPHEIIARRLARSQISSFSVFEGVGRTLKGRDLSKMRNSVLIKTGFLESL